VLRDRAFNLQMHSMHTAVLRPNHAPRFYAVARSDFLWISGWTLSVKN